MALKAVGYSRRNWLVPIPRVQCIDELNHAIRLKCDAESKRKIAGAKKTIGEVFAEERNTLLPLPSKVFEACVVQTAYVDNYGTVSAARNHYSVPPEAIDKRLFVRMFWNKIEITDGAQLLACHRRSNSVGEFVFDPFHYIDTLARKPHAIPYAAPIVNHEWPDGYWEFFERSKNQHGPSIAGREFVRLLKIHQQYGGTLTGTAVRNANELQSSNCDVVLSIIHRSARKQSCPDQLETMDAALLHHEVRMPDVTQYNRLLGDKANDKQCIA